MTVRFWPRRPRFPIIIDTGQKLLGARSSAECSRLLSRAAIPEGAISTVAIDANAEGFAYYSEPQVISPFAVKKRWNKLEIIELYHTRKRPGAPEYSTTSLGNKRSERVVSEIVELVRLPLTST